MHYGKTIRRTTWVYLLFYLALPLAFLTKTLYARELNIVDYGLFFGLFAFFSILTQLRDWGLSAASLYYVNKYLVKGEHSRVKTLFFLNHGFQLATVLVILPILIIIKPYILTTVYRNEGHIGFLFNFFIIYWLIESIHAINIAFINIFQEQHVSRIFDIISRIIILASSFILFKFVQDFQVPAYAFITAILAVGIGASLYLAMRHKQFLTAKSYTKPDLVNEYVRFAGIAACGAFSSILLLYADTFLVQYFLGAREVAYYTTAFSLAEMIILVITPLSIITPPLFNRLWQEKKLEELSKISSFLFNHLLAVILPVSLTVLILADRIVYVIVGPAFAASVPILAIFCILEIFKAHLTFLNQMFIAQGRIKRATTYIIIVGIFNVLLDILLITSFGSRGAALAMLFSFIFWLVLVHREVKKYIALRIEPKTIGKIFLANLIFAGSLYTLKKQLHLFSFGISWNYIGDSLIGFTIAFACYIGMLFLFGILSKQKISRMIALMKKKPMD